VKSLARGGCVLGTPIDPSLEETNTSQAVRSQRSRTSSFGSSELSGPAQFALAEPESLGGAFNPHPLWPTWLRRDLDPHRCGDRRPSAPITAGRARNHTIHLTPLFRISGTTLKTGSNRRVAT